MVGFILMKIPTLFIVYSDMQCTLLTYSMVQSPP